MEQELEEITLADLIVSGDQSVFDCGLADSFVIDTLAVVFHLYIDMVATVVRAHGDVALLGLAGMVAVFRFLKPVSDRVANKVDERIRYLLNDVVIEFGVSAIEREFHVFAAG